MARSLTFTRFTWCSREQIVNSENVHMFTPPYKGCVNVNIRNQICKGLDQ